MKQTELVKAFVNGATQREAKSLHLVGDQLIHYNTPIAERHGGKIILNYTRYSLATGKVQKMITDLVPSELLIFVKGVEAETKGSLARFCNEDKVPESYIALAIHKTLGHGYVISIEGNKLTASFKGKVREFLYPDVIERGLLTILKDCK
ncbi:hypothetical protein SAMN05216348_105200 [Olsenella sp. KH3B4]|uniref:hypothetical protein n=1 Tax=Olsenella sp. KH3B4 TaxID=1855394 RepID=UPI0008BDBB07|nr:hypothetical protein [Olsenella sp. KH3B4]SET03020.1 hypothetical protein SAMN05216348_105200 [Olsenella sp. KH3B4]